MTDTPHPWDRRAAESDPAFEAFAAYLDTGSLRDAWRQRSGKAQGRRRHVNKPSKPPHWGNIPLWARQGSRTGIPQ